MCVFIFPAGSLVQEISATHLLWSLEPFKTIAVKYMPSAVQTVCQAFQRVSRRKQCLHSQGEVAEPGVVAKQNVKF